MRRGCFEVKREEWSLERTFKSEATTVLGQSSLQVLLGSLRPPVQCQVQRVERRGPFSWVTVTFFPIHIQGSVL